MDIELDYDKDSEIDETALDVELLEQGNLARKYAKHLVHIRKLEKKAHEKVKTLRSELIGKTAAEPLETTGKKSPNAGDIEAYYRRDEEYKTAKQDWIEAFAELEYAEQAQKEISYGRRKSIEGLITLHGQQWFAGPKVPRNLTEAREARQKEANAKVRMKRSK